MKKKEILKEQQAHIDEFEEMDKINKQIQKQGEEECKYKITKSILWAVIIVLVLMLYILCHRMGKIGYNYLSIWNPNQVVPIIIKAENIEVDTKQEMNIFGDIIAPMSKGTFKFSVQNDTNEDVVYHIQFLDEMSTFVNMKYRLKMDNIYIVGNKDEYVSIDKMNLKSIISPKDSTSIYVLEWFWESDDEKDTYVGSKAEEQYYGLTIHIYSQAYKE